MSVREIQIAVIGGGPAGLQAALTLGRMHREAIVFDSSEYRNAPVETCTTWLVSMAPHPLTSVARCAPR